MYQLKPAAALLLVLLFGHSEWRRTAFAQPRSSIAALLSQEEEADAEWKQVLHLYNSRRWRLLTDRGLSLQARRSRGEEVGVQWGATRDAELAEILMEACLHINDLDAAKIQFERVVVARKQWEAERKREKLQYPGFKVDNGYSETALTALKRKFFVDLASLFLYTGHADTFQELASPFLSELQKLAETDESGEAQEACAILQALAGNSAVAVASLEASRSLSTKHAVTVVQKMRDSMRELGVSEDKLPDPDAYVSGMTDINAGKRILAAALTRDWKNVPADLRAHAQVLEGIHNQFVNGWAFQQIYPGDEYRRFDIRHGTEASIFQLVPLWDPSLVTAGFEQTINLRKSRVTSVGAFAHRTRPSLEQGESFPRLSAAASMLVYEEPLAVAQQDRSLFLERRSGTIARRAGIAPPPSPGDDNDQGLLKASPWIDVRQCQQGLSPGQAVLEIVKSRTIDVASPESGYRLTPLRYGGWCLTQSGDPHFVDIGPASEIDPLINEIRRATQQAPLLLQEISEAEAVERIQVPLKHLSDRLLTPFENRLQSVEDLIICPDGELWLLPWAALPVGDSVLLEKCNLSFRFTAAELIAPKPAHAAVAGRPLIFTNPDYDATPDEMREVEYSLFRSERSDRVSTKVHGGKRLLPGVPDLPGTEEEATAIAPLLAELSGEEPYVYRRRYASESVVHVIKRPEYLLFQTHGYFLPDPAVDNHPSTADGAVTMASSSRGVSDFFSGLPKGYEPLDLTDPLIRSGLLLAGANRSDEWKEIRSAEGILTAREAALLDLRGTRLVVLSACETGVGEVPFGEGVAGLRLAFQLAGAEAVVASLWQVDDATTAETMTEFVRQLQAGISKSQALRNAQLAQRRSRTERLGAAHPFYWAAFTITGN